MSDTSGTEIVRAPLNTQMAWAEAVAAAGDLIPRAFRDRAKVLVAIQYGAMLDVNPIVAMNEIHVINGVPTMSAHLMAATVRRAHHKVRVKTTGTWDDGDFAATVTIIRTDDPEPFVATWTKARAERAGLVGKDNWKHYPEAMCKARATTEVCRDAAAECLMGIKYSPEELGAVVDESGEPIDAEIVDEHTGEVAAAPAAKPRFEAETWENRIGEALGDLEALRVVYRDANRAGVLEQQLSNGETVAAIVQGLAARLEQDQATEEPS